MGSIRLQYQYVNCARCQGGSSPLDAALVLTARRKPLNVPKAAIQLTKEIPDETACELFEELTGRP